MLCFVAFLIAIGSCGWLTLLVVRAHVTKDGLFSGWRDIMKAFEEANTRRARIALTVCLLLEALRIVVRTGRWAALAAYYTASLGCAGAVCGIVDWRGMLRDLYDFMLKLRAGQATN